MRATAIANSASPHLSTLSSLVCRKLVAASQTDQARAARSCVAWLREVSRRWNAATRSPRSAFGIAAT